MRRGMDLTDREVEDAIWRGDDALLSVRLRCTCCCAEHTFVDCPARRWHGCRGQTATALSSADVEAWAAHYARHRGMSRAEFFGEERPE